MCPGDEVDAAFGYRADPTLLAPTAAQQGVGGEGEDQQCLESRRGRHPNLVRCSYRQPYGREGAETWVGVQGRELQRAPEVLDVALAGVDGLSM